MHPTETPDQFRFSRGHPLTGWVFTAGLLATILYFLHPLLARGTQHLQEDSLDRIWQSLSQASTGSLCLLTTLGLFVVLVVVSVVNGLLASCSVVFDKETGLVTRAWQLGLLRDKETHPLRAVLAIGYTAEDSSSADVNEPSWTYTLKCFLEGDKSYELTNSANEETIVKLARRLQGFLGHPTDGKLRRDAWRLAEKIGAAKQHFEELKANPPHPVTGAVAHLLAGQMERLEAALQRAVPAGPSGNDSPEACLDRLRSGPCDPDLHLKVAAELRAQKRHAEAAAVLERGVDLWARAEAAVRDPECADAAPRDPEKLARAHPVRAEPMRGLWEQVRLRPEEPGPYFLLAVALRVNGWASAARGCAVHAVLLRQASGAIPAAEAEEMLRDFPPGPSFGPPSSF